MTRLHRDQIYRLLLIVVMVAQVRVATHAAAAGAHIRSRWLCLACSDVCGGMAAWRQGDFLCAPEVRGAWLACGHAPHSRCPSPAAACTRCTASSTSGPCLARACPSAWPCVRSDGAHRRRSRRVLCRWRLTSALTGCSCWALAARAPRPRTLCPRSLGWAFMPFSSRLCVVRLHALSPSCASRQRRACQFVITAICCEPEPHGDLPYWLPRRLRIFACVLTLRVPCGARCCCCC